MKMRNRLRKLRNKLLFHFRYRREYGRMIKFILLKKDYHMGLKKIKISYYRKNCIGCGACVNIAPQNWEMSKEDGLSCLKGAVDKKTCFIGEIDVEVNKQAEKICPVNIIKVHN